MLANFVFAYLLVCYGIAFVAIIKDMDAVLFQSAQFFREEDPGREWGENELWISSFILILMYFAMSPLLVPIVFWGIYKDKEN